MPEMVFVVVLKCVSGIMHQCETYREQGWEEKIAKHLL